MSSIKISEDVAKISEDVAKVAVQAASSEATLAASSEATLLPASSLSGLPNNNLPPEIARLATRFSRVQETSVAREAEVIVLNINGMKIQEIGYFYINVIQLLFIL